MKIEQAIRPMQYEQNTPKAVKKIYPKIIDVINRAFNLPPIEDVAEEPGVVVGYGAEGKGIGGGCGWSNCDENHNYDDDDYY